MMQENSLRSVFTVLIGVKCSKFSCSLGGTTSPFDENTSCFLSTPSNPGRGVPFPNPEYRNLYRMEFSGVHTQTQYYGHLIPVLKYINSYILKKVSETSVVPLVSDTFYKICRQLYLISILEYCLLIIARLSRSFYTAVQLKPLKCKSRSSGLCKKSSKCLYSLCCSSLSKLQYNLKNSVRLRLSVRSLFFLLKTSISWYHLLLKTINFWL